LELATLKDKEVEFALASKPTNPKDIIGSDKLPLGLIPGATKAYLSIGHLEGDLKYGRVNWREAGVRTTIYLDALERHIEKFKAGEWEDPVTKIPHLANALACISIIIDAAHAGKLEDDRPKPNTGYVLDSLPKVLTVPQLIDSFSEKVKHLKSLFGAAKPTDYFISGPKERE
jgi:hypothetical protein